MRRRHFLQRLLWLLPALAPLAVIQAKPKRRSSASASSGNDGKLAAASAKTDPARLRLWRVSDPASDAAAFKVRLLPVGKPDSAGISLAVEGLDFFANYAEVPSGAAVIEVSAPDHAPVRLPVYLASGAPSTLLIRQQGSLLNVDWIDDTLNAPAEAGGDLSIYNLLSATGDIQISVGDALNAKLSATRGSLRLSGIKRALYPIAVTALDPSGKGFRWSSDVDFRRCRKATLLVALDPYGRVRPRLVIDNEASAAPVADATPSAQ